MDFSQRANDAASLEVNHVLCPMLDAVVTAKRDKEYAETRGSGTGKVAAKRIGAGYIGEDCGRCLAFRFHKCPKEERDSGVNAGELQRHAEAGHWTEARTVEWLRLCGLYIETVAKDAEGRIMEDDFGNPKQIGWMAAHDPATNQYRMAGEVDGMILGFLASPFTPPQGLEKLKALIKPPCIFESKKATDKKWKKFSKEGVKKADGKYYGQLQTNMAYLGVSQTLFSMLNLDSMKFYFELVPFDREKAQYLSDRALQVIDSQHPYQFPRLGRTEDDFVCRCCDYPQQCWHPTSDKTAHIQGPFPLRGFSNPNEMDEVPFP